MDYFTLAVYVIVIAVNFDQACISSHTVRVVVQASVLGHDSVFCLILFRELQFAVLSEAVASFRQQTIGLADPVAAAMNHFAV